jgi:hypothetical protein
MTGFVFTVISFLAGFIGVALVMESPRHSAVQVTRTEPAQGPAELTVDCYGYRVFSRTSNDANALRNEGQILAAIPLFIWFIAGTFSGWIGWQFGSRIARRRLCRPGDSETTEASDYDELNRAPSDADAKHQH